MSGLSGVSMKIGSWFGSGIKDTIDANIRSFSANFTNFLYFKEIYIGSWKFKPISRNTMFPIMKEMTISHPTILMSNPDSTFFLYQIFSKKNERIRRTHFCSRQSPSEVRNCFARKCIIPNSFIKKTTALYQTNY